MKLLQALFVLLTKCQAKESMVSYPWNSTPMRNSGLSGEAHRLLKQGLKIGYLPPSRHNCKLFSESQFKRSYQRFFSAQPVSQCK